MSGLFGGFSKIKSQHDASLMARSGGGAGLALAVAEAIGIFLEYYSVDFATLKLTAKSAFEVWDIVGAGVGVGIVLLILFMSWRTYVGKGFVSPLLLLALLIFEVYFKFIEGKVSGGWTVVYIIVATGLIGGCRAAWYLRNAHKRAKEMPPADLSSQI